MNQFQAFLKRKDIEISLRRYGIDALGAMAQGLFCSLLIGTIINTIGTQFHIGALTQTVATINGTDYTVGGLTSAMSGPAMAVAIGYALKCPLSTARTLFVNHCRLFCQRLGWRRWTALGSLCRHCCR